MNLNLIQLRLENIGFQVRFWFLPDPLIVVLLLGQLVWFSFLRTPTPADQNEFGLIYYIPYATVNWLRNVQYCARAKFCVNRAFTGGNTAFDKVLTELGEAGAQSGLVYEYFVVRRGDWRRSRKKEMQKRSIRRSTRCETQHQSRTSN